MLARIGSREPTCAALLKIGDEDVPYPRVKTPEVGERAGELAGSDNAECEQDDAPSVGG